MSEVKTDNIKFHKSEVPEEPAVYDYADRGTFLIHAQAIKFNGIFIFTGQGTPLNVVNAPLGSMYLNQDGGANTTLYIKEAETLIGDSAGWAAI